MTADRSLRVLYVIPDLGKGGAERFVIDLASALRRRNGVEVVIAALHDRNLYRELTAALQIEQLDFEPFARRTTNTCPAYDALLDRFRPDVVHTHLFLAEFLSTYRVSPEIAYVCHGHDNMPQLTPLSWRTFTSRAALTNFYERQRLFREKYDKVPTAFIANSTHTRDYFRHVLPRRMRDDIVLLPYGFDYERFVNERAAPPAERERVRLLNVGSFQEKKNQRFLVAVARELVARGLDFDLDLVGDGVERPAVERAVEEAGLRERVHFHGNVDNVEAWMRRSHVYVHSATYEPFGLVFLEAMAAGLPCVTLDGKGNRDVIEDGRTGFLLETDDPVAFAGRIIELAADREHYRELSGNARRGARAYDITDVAERFLDFYRARVQLVRGQA